MPFSLNQIGDEVLAFLDTTVFPAQEVVEQAIPDVEQIEVDEVGYFDPYISVNLGDLQPWGSTSFVGPMGDDYVLPVYVRCIAPDTKMARLLMNRGIESFLGVSFDWAGQVRKRVGGAIYPLKTSNGALEAYVAPLSFGLTLQLAQIP